MTFLFSKSLRKLKIHSHVSTIKLASGNVSAGRPVLHQKFVGMSNFKFGFQLFYHAQVISFWSDAKIPSSNRAFNFTTKIIAREKFWSNFWPRTFTNRKSLIISVRKYNKIVGIDLFLVDLRDSCRCGFVCISSRHRGSDFLTCGAFFQKKSVTQPTIFCR